MKQKKIDSIEFFIGFFQITYKHRSAVICFVLCTEQSIPFDFNSCLRNQVKAISKGLILVISEWTDNHLVECSKNRKTKTISM